MQFGIAKSGCDIGGQHRHLRLAGYAQSRDLEMTVGIGPT